MKTAAQVVGDSYFQMVRAFPLRPVRSDAQSRAAQKVLDRWFGQENLDAGQEDYVEALATLVADYENRVHPAESEDRTVAQRLKALISEAGMTQTAFAAIAGIDQSLVSQILAGKRELSKKSVKLLASHFAMSADYFL